MGISIIKNIYITLTYESPMSTVPKSISLGNNSLKFSLDNAGNACIGINNVSVYVFILMVS